MTLIETAQKIWEHGFTWMAVFSAIVGWVKWRKEVYKGKLNKQMANEVHAIFERVGTWSAEKRNTRDFWEKSYPISSREAFISAPDVALSIYRTEQKFNFGGIKMLKKLDSRKLQMVLVPTIINLCLLIGYVFDVQDIQSKVEAWTPLINVGIQTLLGIAYAHIEGKVDAARAQNGGFPDGKALDSVARDSIDA